MSALSPYVELVELALGGSNNARTLARHVHSLATRCQVQQGEDHAQAVLADMTARPEFWADAAADRSPAAQRVLRGSREPEDVEPADRAFDAYVMRALKNRALSAHRREGVRRAGLAELLRNAEAGGLVVEPGTGGTPKDVGMHPDTDADADRLFRGGMLVLKDIAEEIHEGSPKAEYDPRVLLVELLEFALSPESLLERMLAKHADPLTAKKAYDACTKRHSRLREQLAARLERWIADGRVTAEAGSSASLLLQKFLNRRPKAESSAV
ncbi:MAG: hypothetical protein H6716_20740 [Polyangiaceae bacterium]|nr:hypothetical protein [Polyangiaceae bacterium]